MDENKKKLKGYRIGIYLDRALRMKNVSVLTLSKLTGIENGMLYRYLSNTRCPSYETIEKIAEALELKPDYFTSETYYSPEELLTANGTQHELRAHIANSDLLVNIDKNDPKTFLKAHEELQKLNTQIFNSLTNEGKEKFVMAEYDALLNDYYPIAFEEKNDKKFWDLYWIFDDKSAIESMKSSDRKNFNKLKYEVIDLFKKNGTYNDNQKNIINSFLNKLKNIKKED